MIAATNDEKTQDVYTVMGQDIPPTNEPNYSSNPTENNGYIDQVPQPLEVTIAAPVGAVITWLWCSTCQCLTNAVMFDACAVCGRVTDQLETVDEVEGRHRLEAIS